MKWDWRTIAGIAVLVALVLMGILLVPPYIENWKLQSYLDELANDPATASRAPEVLQANIVNKASQLSLPVKSADVNVTRSGTAVKIEVLYVVHVELFVYSVDLHFRPKI